MGTLGISLFLPELRSTSKPNFVSIFNAEQIIVLLRQIDVLTSEGKTPAIACREAGVSAGLKLIKPDA
jgi:hypothetical protein